MNNPIKVSVLMPSLNVGPFIRQCIESVCQQTLRDIEILCIDAGSTDGTLEVLEEFATKDSRIQLLHSDIKSYGYQMNLGLQKAKGSYIGIVETDDFAEPDMFEKLYAAAEKYQAEIVKSNIYRYYQGNNTFSEWLSGLPYERVFSPQKYLSFFMRPPHIWAGIYKRDFLLQNNICFLETPGASYQDEGFMLKNCISADRVVLLKDAYLHYRTDNENSSVKSKGKVLFVQNELLSVHEYLELKPEKKKHFERILWTREAEKVAWNYNRITDELRYDFLSEVQSRLQFGLANNLFLRAHLSWRIWKLVLEVAENPLIYMRSNCDRNVFAELMQKESIKKPTASAFKAWEQREKRMKLPQTAIDIICFWKHYGLNYCLKQIHSTKS